MIRHGNTDGIYLVGHLVEHFSEILKLRQMIKLFSKPAAAIDITLCNDISQSCIIQPMGDVATLPSCSDTSQIDFFIGSEHVWRHNRK